jgi:hypothetical protein
VRSEEKQSPDIDMAIEFDNHDESNHRTLMNIRYAKQVLYEREGIDAGSPKGNTLVPGAWHSDGGANHNGPGNGGRSEFNGSYIS